MVNKPGVLNPKTDGNFRLPVEIKYEKKNKTKTTDKPAATGPKRTRPKRLKLSTHVKAAKKTDNKRDTDKYATDFEPSNWLSPLRYETIINTF